MHYFEYQLTLKVVADIEPSQKGGLYHPPTSPQVNSLISIVNEDGVEVDLPDGDLERIKEYAIESAAEEHINQRA